MVKRRRLAAAPRRSTPSQRSGTRRAVHRENASSCRGSVPARWHQRLDGDEGRTGVWGSIEGSGCGRQHLHQTTTLGLYPRGGGFAKGLTGGLAPVNPSRELMGSESSGSLSNRFHLTS
ncbi:unnamed protein product [Gadus morhua 'NCC']